MRKIFFLAVTIFVITTTALCQSKLGEVACVYVTTTDLDSSMGVYEMLGFEKIASNTFPVPWMQASDGSLLIMMRKDAKPYIGLTYYVADIEKVAGQLQKDSIVFTQAPNPGDPIKRYYFKSPDGLNIMLASNLGGFTKPGGATMLNMNSADFASVDKYPNPKSGVFGEFCHPVTDLNRSIAFWKKLGFMVKSQQTSPYPFAILFDGLMIIGLHQTKEFSYPAVTYFGLNTEKRIQQLKDQGLRDFNEMTGKNNQVLKTWEGQHFFLFSFGM